MGVLIEIAERYGISKARMEASLPKYEVVWDSIRASVKRVLVVSRGHGPSIKMWLEYFPEAVVYGVGGQKEYTRELVGFNSRYRPFAVEPFDVKLVLSSFLGEMKVPFDLIVDEGGFLPGDGKVVFETLVVRLGVGGVYVLDGCEALDQGCTESVVDSLRREIALLGEPPTLESSSLYRILYDRATSVVLYGSLVFLWVGIKHFVFDEAYYLSQYPDVANAIKVGQFSNGLNHFLLFGMLELRKWRLIAPRCLVMGG